MKRMDLPALGEKVKPASAFLKVLAGRERLSLLVHLAGGEKSVGELARLTDARDTAVSQQLGILRQNQIVTTRRDGVTIFYSLASEDAGRVLEALEMNFAIAVSK